MSPDKSAALQSCIVDCLECYSLCRQAAAAHAAAGCSSALDAEHLQLLEDCAEACRVAADFMLRGSRNHAACCAFCAHVCDACAQSCDLVGGMDACAAACRGCARSCRALADG